MSNFTDDPDVGLELEHTETVDNIKWVAYSVVAYVIVGVGILGNLASLVVLTRPNLKGVMYVYLLGLAVSNLCVLISALPALFDMSSGLGGGHYTTAFFQAHLMLPLINSFMASSVYIIICMTVNRYISIYKPTDFQRLHTQKNARVSISLSFFFGIIFHIPLCFHKKVVNSCGAPESNSTVELVNGTKCIWEAYENFQVSENYVFKIYIFISETFLRVGPIVTLAILNILIIHKFLKIAKRRQSLKNRKVATVNMPPEQTSMSSSPLPSRNISTTSTTQASSTSNASYNPGSSHLTVPSFPSRATSPTPSCVSTPTPEPTTSRRHSRPRHRQRVLQNSEERMLVVVLISIIVLFVCCTTPAAVLSVLYSVKLDQHLGFQIFRAIANNLELLNFALNFYIYCLCSAEIRRAFVSLFRNFCEFWTKKLCQKQDVIIVQVDHV